MTAGSAYPNALVKVTAITRFQLERDLVERRRLGSPLFIIVEPAERVERQPSRCWTAAARPS
jgi:hypothetical protein